MLGAAVEEDGSAVEAEAALMSSSEDIDRGSADGGEAYIAALDDDGPRLVFSLAVSDMAEMVGKEECMGEVVGIKTSLSGPCEPAPVLVEGSRLLSSMGGFFDGDGALGEGLLDVEAWPAPVSNDVDAAIGRAFWEV
jgi:hypothetical protein